MPWNARISIARSQLRRAICILPLVTIGFGPLIAQEITPEAYQAGQQKLHQQVAAIRNDLNSGVPRPGTKAWRRFSSQMRSGIRSTDPGYQEFLDVLRYSIFELSDPDLVSNGIRAQQVKASVERRISDAGSQIRVPGQQERVRSEILSEVLAALEELAQNNFVARSAAIELMPTLLVFAPRNKPLAVRRMLSGVGRSLAAILADPKQPDTVKLRAVMSIKLHLNKVIATSVDQEQYVQAIHDELASPVKHPVYQLFLIDTLSAITIPRQVTGDSNALAIETLVMVMQDQRRDFRTRCRAAYGLGQVGFDRQVTFDPIAWKIAQLAVQAGEACNADNEQGNSWNACGLGLYLAFHHVNAAGAQGPNPQGLLNRAPSSPLVNEAYGKVLPIARDLMAARSSVSKDVLKSTSEWVTENQPENLSYEPQAEPIVP